MTDGANQTFYSAAKTAKFSIFKTCKQAVPGQNTRHPPAQPENYCESKQTYFSYSVDKAFHLPEFLLYFSSRFLRHYSSCGIVPNFSSPRLFTHLDIHLKHTGELAWVPEGSLPPKPPKSGKYSETYLTAPSFLDRKETGRNIFLLRHLSELPMIVKVLIF